MKLAIRVTDPGNDAKWNFLFSIFNNLLLNMANYFSVNISL